MGLGEGAEVPAGEQTDLLRDGLLRGAGAALPGRVGENARALLAQDFASESAMPVDTAQRVGVQDTRAREGRAPSFMHSGSGK